MIFDDDDVAFIHEPARLLLMTSLFSVKKTDFVFLLNSTGMSRGNLSVQMTRLAKRGLVEINKGFENNRPRTVYQITVNGKKALKRYKRRMQEILADLPG